jgi:hypothetical protein
MAAWCGDCMDRFTTHVGVHEAQRVPRLTQPIAATGRRGGLALERGDAGDDAAEPDAASSMEAAKLEAANSADAAGPRDAASDGHHERWLHALGFLSATHAALDTRRALGTTDGIAAGHYRIDGPFEMSSNTGIGNAAPGLANR